MRILVISCLVLLSFFVHAETIKIGYIDTDQVINNLPQYQKNVDKLSKEFEPKKQELLDLFKHIELLRLETNKISDTKDKENLQTKLSKLASLEESFRQETEFWQKMMNNRKIELLQKIEILINTTLNEFAITEDYDLILYSNVAFANDKIDITTEVIERIRKLSL